VEILGSDKRTPALIATVKKFYKTAPRKNQGILVTCGVTRLGKILLFGYFFLEQYLHFQLNKQLQNMVVALILTIKRSWV
jgi:hypothetical protein